MNRVMHDFLSHRELVVRSLDWGLREMLHAGFSGLGIVI